VIQSDRAFFLEEEWILVRNSGEIPEVALHASFYYLSEDAEGPGLVLTEEEKGGLHQAALARYEEIILRDLDPANRDLSLFRGIRRANHNWYRYSRFCEQIGHNYTVFMQQAAQSLRAYLELEVTEAKSGKRSPSVNCSREALLTFALALGIVQETMPEGWEGVCEMPTPNPDFS
jgi:hypothetical protein